MKEFALVAIGYNRVSSLQRLLTSLKNSEFFGHKVELVISIDYSGENLVTDFAQAFHWPFGEKRVISHPSNLGLRDHILFCGGLTSEYANICVFEDDVVVSPGFYNFATQAIAYYKDDEKVAGISLYTHLWNYVADRPFTPLTAGSDAFLIQQAQSWGQVWSRDKWSRFYKWYVENKDRSLQSDNFPEPISTWPKSSWLKYHMKYLVEVNKYFVYPYVSLTTNFTDVGVHARSSISKFQVPLDLSTTKKYSFCPSNDLLVKYDVFFESQFLATSLRLNNDQFTVDLYKTKKAATRYILTSRKLSFEVVKSFGLQLRPQELNVMFDIPGSELTLYDLKAPLAVSNAFTTDSEILYDFRSLSKKRYLKALLILITLSVKNRITRIKSYVR